MSENGAANAARLGLRTISHCDPNSARCFRKASRSRRLIRFRTTAPPMARGTVRPSLALSPGRVVARQNAAKIGLETRMPLSYTVRKSADRRIRDDRGNASLGFGRSRPDGAFVAHRQLVASTGPPARQHCSSVLGFHSRPEAMRFGALSIVRLKCTFRHVVATMC